jgi:hypothetical protein
MSHFHYVKPIQWVRYDAQLLGIAKLLGCHGNAGYENDIGFQQRHHQNDNAGKPYWRGRLSTIDLLLLTKISCFKKSKHYLHFIKRATLMRRSNVLSPPFQLVLPGWRENTVLITKVVFTLKKFTAKWQCLFLPWLHGRCDSHTLSKALLGVLLYPRKPRQVQPVMIASIFPRGLRSKLCKWKWTLNVCIFPKNSAFFYKSI